MLKIESDIKTIAAKQTVVFAVLSDLRNLEKLKSKIPDDKIKDLEFDADALKFKVDMVGQVGMRIIERDAPKTIKFGPDGAPVEFNVWIQLVDKSEYETALKVTLKADIPMMMQMMAKGPLEKFVAMLTDAIALYPFESDAVLEA